MLSSAVSGFRLAAPRPPSIARLRALVHRGFARLVGWQERARERQLLRSLDERLLRDLGLSRADVELLCRAPQEPGGLAPSGRIDF